MIQVTGEKSISVIESASLYQIEQNVETVCNHNVCITGV